jgi:hypothetical protein
VADVGNKRESSRSDRYAYARLIVPVRVKLARKQWKEGRCPLALQGL